MIIMVLINLLILWLTKFIFIKVRDVLSKDFSLQTFNLAPNLSIVDTEGKPQKPIRAFNLKQREAQNETNKIQRSQLNLCQSRAKHRRPSGV